MTSLPKGKIVVPVWSDDDEIKALADDSGQIPVTVENLPTVIETRVHGWDGSAWQKLPMLWGYSERWAQYLTHNKDGDGDYWIDFTAVPEGYVYVLSGIAGSNGLTQVGIQPFLKGSGVTFRMGPKETTPAATWAVVANLSYPLAYQDYVQVGFYGCSHGDNLAAAVWGYKMKVAE